MTTDKNIDIDNAINKSDLTDTLNPAENNPV